MGLFDFVSSAGAKLGIDYFEQREKNKQLDDQIARLKADEELRARLGAAITEAVTAKGWPIEQLAVRVLAGGVAKLSGTAQSQDCKEKCVVFVGNHEGIAKVDDEGMKVVVPEPPGIVHTVAKGDTLSLIAKRYYGIIMAYPEIAAANKELVADVDRIEPGWAIRVPPIQHIAYTVRGGDTLGSIAKTMYGDAKLYGKIFEASKDVMTNPDVVKAGMVLTVPVLHPLTA
jgi:nucleoid-associated protein YgaU